MSDKIVKQHDPNCSFLKVDIETDPTMRSSYGCDCGLHSVADEVTMGDAWMSGPEDFSKAIEEQINKYRAMFPDSPIHILGTVIPPLNQKDDLYTISKSVLYRNNDKSISFPAQEFYYEVRKNGEVHNTEGAEPDYSTMITPEMNERLTRPITSFSEPSESQEETPAVPWRIEEKPKGWGDVTVMFDANDNCIMYERSPSIQAWRIIVNAVNEKFHITRCK